MQSTLKVILPPTVLRRFDCILGPTKAKVLEKHEKVKERPDKVVQSGCARSLIAQPYSKARTFINLNCDLDCILTWPLLTTTVIYKPLYKKSYM